MGAHRLQQVERAGEVGIRIGLRVLEAVAHARLGGEVDDDVGPHPSEEIVEQAGRLQAALHRLEAGQALKLGVARPLQGDVVVVGEAVEPDDRVPLAQEAPAEVIADEAGRAGHERAHRS